MRAQYFLSQVKEIGALPDGRFTDVDILEIANNEMPITVQSVLSCREDYMVESKALSLSDIQSGLGFRIPPYFIGNKVRQIDAVGDGQRHLPVARITLDQLEEGLAGYMLVGGRIRGRGLETFGPSFQVYYHGRPGTLESLEQNNDTDLRTWCPTISSVSGSTLFVQLGDYASKSVGLGQQMVDDQPFFHMDVFKGDGGQEYLARDLTVVPNISSGTVVLPVDAAELGIEAGDVLGYAGRTDQINLPQDFCQVHIQRVVCKCLESLGDTQALQVAEQKLVQAEAAAVGMMSQRDDGRPQRITVPYDNPWRRSVRRRW